MLVFQLGLLLCLLLACSLAPGSYCVLLGILARKDVAGLIRSFRVRREPTKN